VLCELREAAAQPLGSGSVRPATVLLDLHARGLYPVPLRPGTRTGLVKWGHVDEVGYPGPPDVPRFRDGPVVDCDHLGEGCDHPVVGSGRPYASWLREWLDRWPGADWAVLTGRSRLLLLDVDPRHGGDRSLRQLCAEVPLPRTLTVRTRSGGIHLYYRLPRRARLRKSSVGELAEGLDVRSSRGLAVCPPTPGYSLLDTAPVALVPPPLLARCPAAGSRRRGDRSTGGKLPLPDPEAQQVVQHALQRIRESGPGTRHDTVYGQSRYVFKYCGDKAIDELLLNAAVHDSPPPRYVANYRRAIADARRKATGN